MSWRSATRLMGSPNDWPRLWAGEPGLRSSGWSGPETGSRPQVTQALERRQRQPARLAAQLDALSPLRVLERGFALPRGEDGRILRRVADFESALRFRLRVQDGEVPAKVERN